MSVSRPKTVMNQGVPAAGRCRVERLRSRIRSAARSASDAVPRVRRGRPTPERRHGGRAPPGRRCDSSARPALLERARERRAGSGSPRRASGCTPTTSLQRSPGSSSSANRTTPPSTVHGTARRCTTVSGREALVGEDHRPVLPRPRPGGRGSGSVTSAGFPKLRVEALTEKMSAKSAASSSAELGLDAATAVVLDHDPLLHAVADEALPLDRRARSGCRPAAAGCAARTGEVRRGLGVREGSRGAGRRASAPSARGSGCRRRRSRTRWRGRRRRRARRRRRTSSRRGP